MAAHSHSLWALDPTSSAEAWEHSTGQLAQSSHGRPSGQPCRDCHRKTGYGMLTTFRTITSVTLILSRKDQNCLLPDDKTDAVASQIRNIYRQAMSYPTGTTRPSPAFRIDLGFDLPTIPLMMSRMIQVLDDDMASARKMEELFLHHPPRLHFLPADRGVSTGSETQHPICRARSRAPGA